MYKENKTLMLNYLGFCTNFNAYSFSELCRLIVSRTLK